MNGKESIVAYPHEIKFIDKNGGKNGKRKFGLDTN